MAQEAAHHLDGGPRLDGERGDGVPEIMQADAPRDTGGFEAPGKCPAHGLVLDGPARGPREQPQRLLALHGGLGPHGLHPACQDSPGGGRQGDGASPARLGRAHDVLADGPADGEPAPGRVHVPHLEGPRLAEAQTAGTHDEEHGVMSGLQRPGPVRQGPQLARRQPIGLRRVPGCLGERALNGQGDVLMQQLRAEGAAGHGDQDPPAVRQVLVGEPRCQLRQPPGLDVGHREVRQAPRAKGGHQVLGEDVPVGVAGAGPQGGRVQPLPQRHRLRECRGGWRGHRGWGEHLFRVPDLEPRLHPVRVGLGRLAAAKRAGPPMAPVIDPHVDAPVAPRVAGLAGLLDLHAHNLTPPSDGASPVGLPAVPHPGDGDDVLLGVHQV